MRDYTELTIKELETMISATDIFVLDPEKETNAYLTEERNLLTLIYLYGDKLWNAEARAKGYADETYSEELLALGKRCIRAFRLEKGSFLHYLKHSMKVEKKRIDAKKAASDIWIVSDTFEGADGSEESLLDLLTGDISAEDKYMEMEACRDILKRVDEVYSGQQSRSKEVMSALLTNAVMSRGMSGELIGLAAEYDFFHMDLAKDILRRGENYSQKEIGLMFGKTAANTCQIYSRFLEKMMGR